MKKVYKNTPQVNIKTNDYKIGTIKNRTVMTEDRGKIIFSNEHMNNHKEKNIYASK